MIILKLVPNSTTQSKKEKRQTHFDYSYEDDDEKNGFEPLEYFYCVSNLKTQQLKKEVKKKGKKEKRKRDEIEPDEKIVVEEGAEKTTTTKVVSPLDPANSIILTAMIPNVELLQNKRKKKDGDEKPKYQRKSVGPTVISSHSTETKTEGVDWRTVTTLMTQEIALNLPAKKRVPVSQREKKPQPRKKKEQLVLIASTIETSHTVTPVVLKEMRNPIYVSLPHNQTHYPTTAREALAMSPPVSKSLFKSENMF